MKNKTKIDKEHYFKLNNLNTGSNYNTFIHVFKVGEKQPIFGSSFKDNTPLSEIAEYCENKIKDFYSKKDDNLFGIL